MTGARAVALCGGHWGRPRGRPGRGLARHPRRYEIVGIIDGTKAGRDAGDVRDGRPCGIPIVASLRETLERLRPDTLILGVATFGGYIPAEFRPVIRQAIESGLDVAAGLHEHLAADPEFSALAAKHGVHLIDVRKPRPLREPRQVSDLSRALPCLRVPVLGTDGAIGKRTTALLLVDGLNAAGISATFVATGQTGLLQGADFGVPVDAIPGDFVVGELEWEIHRAYEATKPKVNVVVGQGSINHPAYVMGPLVILIATITPAIAPRHVPPRPPRTARFTTRSCRPPTAEDEIGMLELFSRPSRGRVIAITLNHEDLTRAEIDATVAAYEAKYGLPTCDPLWHGVGRVVSAIREHE